MNTEERGRRAWTIFVFVKIMSIEVRLCLQTKLQALLYSHAVPVLDMVLKLGFNTCYTCVYEQRNNYTVTDLLLFANFCSWCFLHASIAFCLQTDDKKHLFLVSKYLYSAKAFPLLFKMVILQN